MAGRAKAGEKPGGGEQERSSADRCHIGGSLGLPAQEAEDLRVFHERGLAWSAWHEKNIRLRAIREGRRRQDPKAAGIAGDRLKILPDKMNRQFPEPCEDFERPGEIKLGQPRVKKHDDIHGATQSSDCSDAEKAPSANL